jgi:hypothetical protein
MNRLKSLPWIQILLFLLLAATVANYFELRRVEGAVNDVQSEMLRSSLRHRF